MAWQKIDSDAVNDDEALHSAVGVQLVDNIEQDVGDLDVGAGHAYQIDPVNLLTAPVWATHPDYWFCVPVLVPRVPGLTTATLYLGYEVANASVDVRLRVGGRVGSTSTLTTTGGRTLGTIASVTLPPVSRPGGWHYGEIQIRSQVDTGSADSCDIVIQQGERAFVIDGLSTISPTVNAVARYLLEVDANTPGFSDDAQHRFFVGYVRDPYDATTDGDMQIWPTTPLLVIPNQTGKSTTGVLSPLGELTCHGWAIQLSGGPGTWPLLRAENYSSGETVRASDARLLSHQMRRLYDERARWYVAGPLRTESQWHGNRHTTDGKRAAAGLVEVRDGVIGVRAAVLGAGLLDANGDEIKRTFTLTLENISASGTVTESREITWQPRGARRTPAGHGLLSQYDRDFVLGGAGDLEFERGSERLQMAEVEALFDSGWSNGDLVSAVVTVDAPVYVGAASIADWTITGIG